MSINMIRVPQAIAIVIAQYPLSLKELEEAIRYKQTHKHNPPEISVMLYSPDERELAHAEYLILAGKKLPRYFHQHSVYNETLNTNQKQQPKSKGN